MFKKIGLLIVSLALVCGLVFGADSARNMGATGYIDKIVGIADISTGDVAEVDTNGKLSVLGDTEMPAAAALADNTANPTTTSIGSLGLYYDGSTWDRMRGDSTDGLLVNLGTNNDVDSELPSAALLANNASTPTAPAVGAFGMVFDGSGWDLLKGDSTDGMLVNLGTNNDVTVTGSVTADTELPAAALLADATATPTITSLGSFGLMYNGATWDMLRGDATNGLLVNLGTNNDVTADTELTAVALMADNAATPTITSMASYGLMYDGSAWDMLRGDATNGLLVNLGTNNDVTVTGSVTADTEMPAAASLADDTSNPSTTSTGALLLGYDGSAWDRLRGDSTNGLLVNLGSNNDVTVTGSVTADTELIAVALLADNTATPTVTSLGSFGMMYDGSNWDMLRGDGTNGLLVNLGSNNDVTADTELPAAALMANTTATPTVPAFAAFGMVYNGTSWDMLKGDAADGMLVHLSSNEVTVSGNVDADTELSAAAALADATANPTVTSVGTFGMMYNGSTWDRLLGDSTDGLMVNVTNSDVVVSQATAANLKVDLSGTAANATAIKVDGSAVTQPVNIAEHTVTTSTPVNAITLDDDPTAYTSSAISTGGYDKITFFWDYDETEVGNSVSATMTITVSADNVTYMPASFYDYAGGTTPQTSEALSGDGSYYCWFNRDLSVPYIKVTITGTNTDVDDTALNTVKVYMQK